MEESNTKLLDVNGIPLLKWYLPNTKDKGEASNIENKEIKDSRNEIQEEILNINNNILIDSNNLAFKERNQETSDSIMNSLIQNSETSMNNSLLLNDSSMQNLGSTEIRSMSYNLRERLNVKNVSSQKSFISIPRSQPIKERRGRKRKLPNEISPIPKSARKSLFNEVQIGYFNTTPLIKKIKSDLIEKELLLKKMDRTVTKWLNGECKPLERNEALLLLENVKTINAELMLFTEKLKSIKLSDNRKVLEKNIDQLTFLSNKLDKKLIDNIVECDIQHEGLTEEIDDINNIFPNVVKIDQPTKLSEHKKIPLFSRTKFQENFENISQDYKLHNNRTNLSQQISKGINNNETAIISPDSNKQKTIKPYRNIAPTGNTLHSYFKQEKMNFKKKINSEQVPRKNRQQKTLKKNSSILKLKKAQNQLEVNQTIKSIAKLNLTNQSYDTKNFAIHSQNLTPLTVPKIIDCNSQQVNRICCNVDIENDSNCNSFNVDAIDSSMDNSQIVKNLNINSINRYRNEIPEITLNKLDEINLSCTLKSFDQESDLAIMLNSENEQDDVTVTQESISAVNMNLHKKLPENHQLKSSLQDSNLITKPIVPISSDLKVQNPPINIKIHPVNLILNKDLLKTVVVPSRRHNVQNKETKSAKCFVKKQPLKSQLNTIKFKDSEDIHLKDLNNQKTIDLQISKRQLEKISQNSVQQCNGNCNSKNNLTINSNVKQSSESLPNVVGKSFVNDEFNLKRTIHEKATLNLNGTSNHQLLVQRSDVQNNSNQFDGNYNKIVDNSKTKKTYQEDPLLVFFSSEEVNVDNESSVSKLNVNDKETTSQINQKTSAINKVKNQESQNVSHDDSFNFEDVSTDSVNTIKSSVHETKDILKCINSIKTIRIKSENDFVPINDLTDLIAADDFNWLL